MLFCTRNLVHHLLQAGPGYLRDLTYGVNELVLFSLDIIYSICCGLYWIALVGSSCHRFSKLLPHQLANQTRAHPDPIPAVLIIVSQPGQLGDLTSENGPDTRHKGKFVLIRNQLEP